MDTGGFYRNSSSVTLGLGGGFPGSQNTAHPSPNGFQRALGPTRSPALQINNGLEGDQNHVVHQLGQIASMVSSTQQLLLSQQATSQRLQNEVQKLSNDMNLLRDEMVEIKDLCMEPHQEFSDKSKSTAGRVKVPIELSVSTYIHYNTGITVHR